MKDTNERELYEAIRRFKEKFGMKTPLDMFELDKIIEKMRREKK